MTRKLMLWLTVATILFWVAAAGIGTVVMREEFDEVFDSALQETAQRLMPLVANGLLQRDSSADSSGADIGRAGEEEYLTYQLRDGEGRVLLHSHDAQREPLDAPLKRGFQDTAEDRIYTEEGASGTLFLQVADQLEHRSEAMREASVSLLIPLVFLVPLNMFIIWVLVRRSLEPVELLRAEIGARDGANLSPMTIAALPRELEAISISVNRLFERLRTALEAERAFASDIAHELRTPIAGALAQTQLLFAELPEGASRVRAGQIEATLSTLGRLAEKLLQLARAESGIGLAVEPTDIVSILELVVEDFERKPDHTGRVHYVDQTGGKPIVRYVDVDALGIVFRNLIENALVHGDATVPVEIVMRHDGIISIANGGQVVPAAELRQLIMRFRRGGSAAEGAGLGLAISDMLVRQMGGTLHFASPVPGQSAGFEVTLQLPRIFASTETRTKMVG